MYGCQRSEGGSGGRKLGVYGCQRSEGGSGGRVKKAENVWILGK